MEGKQNISQYRDRLDKTLASHDLSNVEKLKTLVESQMSKPSQCEDQDYSDNLVQKRTKEVANFLGMLRSASASDEEGSKTKEIPHGGWKLKQDNQDCRVMYREGPAGTPFHTLLAEGYVDGPVDNCLCISWESGLYPKWWPQFSIPTFKILSSECLQKVRIGEQISLVRMKLSWPLSTREALVHYVAFEYFQDDLIIVLLNTISDLENIDKHTHGFTRDGIPDVENVTRIDIVGGFALQKVTSERSYFRTIVNMDVKLDFLPPAIINFVSRQLIGSGFKLYKKEVASVSKGDADFGKALKEPFYARVREALYSDNKEPNGVLEQEKVKIDKNSQPEEQKVKINKNSQPEEHSTPSNEEVKDQRPVSEIEEIEETGTTHENNNKKSYEHQNNEILIDHKKKIMISPEVNQALGTLEKVISMIKEYKFNPRSLSFSRVANNVFANLENDKTSDAKRLEGSIKDSTQRMSQGSRNSSGSHSSRHEGYISYAIEKLTKTREEDISDSCKNSFSFAMNESTVLEQSSINGGLEHGHENTLTGKKTKKQRFCCLNFTSGRLIA